jgi:hypothetical protein
MSGQQVKSNKDTHHAIAVFSGLIFTPSLDCPAALSSAKGGLYTPPHISMDSIWSPWGVYMESMRTAFPLLPLFQESMKNSHGVHMDFAKFMDSMKTCDQVSCGLLWTPSEIHGLSMDSLRNL